MATSVTHFPQSITVKNTVRFWKPRLGCFIGNTRAASDAAKKLRSELKVTMPAAVVRRFGNHVNVYL